MFLSETTRPDIASAVNLLSQAFKRPSVQDFIAEKRVLRYLKGKNYTLTYSRYDNGLCFFASSDADYVPETLYLAWLYYQTSHTHRCFCELLNKVRYDYLHVNRTI